MKMQSKHTARTTVDQETHGDVQQLVERVWQELGGQISRRRIYQVAVKVTAVFEHAAVKSNIPLFVRHLTRELLKEELRAQHGTERQPKDPANSLVMFTSKPCLIK